MTRPFVLDIGWSGLLKVLGIDAGDLLRAAGLPGDLLAQARPSVDAGGFARLWDALESLSADPEPGLTVGRTLSPETFSPPLFAAWCSPDLRTALGRLALFKPLVGPLRLDVMDSAHGLEVRLGAEPQVEVPPGYAGAELVFLVNLVRQATRHRVVPLEARGPAGAAGPATEAFLGRRVEPGAEAALVFAPEDAARPFLAANPALFDVFEDGLRARLDAVVQGSGMAERVRAALMESLPAGQGDVASVARRLGVSVRSLQRRLAEEGTSFQAELGALRARLARDYLTGSRYSSAEIAYLLGYEDPNSFVRAFGGWTGTTPEAMRAAAQV